MKTTKKYDCSGNAILKDKKARQYRATSQGSDIGLIAESDKKVDTERQGHNESSSLTSASDFIILVRETPNPVNDVEDTIASSCESMKKNMDHKDIYKTTTDANIYPDLTDATKSPHEEGRNGVLGVSIDAENKCNMESYADETDYKPNTMEPPSTRSTFPRKGKLRFNIPEQRRNQLRRIYPLYACKYRCMLYFSIACCVSILFSCLLSYLSYSK